MHGQTRVLRVGSCPAQQRLKAPQSARLSGSALCRFCSRHTAQSATEVRAETIDMPTPRDASGMSPAQRQVAGTAARAVSSRARTGRQQGPSCRAGRAGRRAGRNTRPSRTVRSTRRRGVVSPPLQQADAPAHVGDEKVQKPRTSQLWCCARGGAARDGSGRGRRGLHCCWETWDQRIDAETRVRGWGRRRVGNRFSCFV